MRSGVLALRQGKPGWPEAVGPSLNPLSETLGLERKLSSQESGSGTETAMRTQEGIIFLKPTQNLAGIPAPSQFSGGWEVTKRCEADSPGGCWEFPG